MRLGERDTVQPITASESHGWTRGSWGTGRTETRVVTWPVGLSIRTLCPHCASRVERNRPGSLLTGEQGNPWCHGVTCPGGTAALTSGQGVLRLSTRRMLEWVGVGRRPGRVVGSRLTGGSRGRRGHFSRCPRGAVWELVTLHTWPPPALPALGSSSCPHQSQPLVCSGSRGTHLDPKPLRGVAGAVRPVPTVT